MKEDLSPSESLHLIESMIAKTRENISENRFYFLMWGWVVFIGVLLQYVLKNIVEYKHHYAVWLITIPAFIVTIVASKRSERVKPRTWIGDSMGYFWMGTGISFFVLTVILSMIPNGWLHAFPFFILFYGLGTFVSGKIISFKPLVVGGIINWILAPLCAMVSYDNQMLVTAAAILCSYLIPGYLIKSEPKNRVYAA